MDERIRHFSGLFIILLLLGIIVWELVTTNGILSWSQTVIMYLCISLVSGISFWLLTKSTGTVNIKEIGVKLTGGAAIGAGFILLLNYLFPLPTNQDLVSIPLYEYKSILVDKESNNNINTHLWKERNQLIIEFRTESIVEVFDAVGVDKLGNIDTMKVTISRDGTYNIE